MPERLIARYAAMVEAGDLAPDPAQRLAAERLDALGVGLRGYAPAAPSERSRGFGFFRRVRDVAKPPKGLYLWGGVGRGKSMLMDLFYECADLSPKRRAHFHAFMQEVHGLVREARATGVSDPIPPVADKIAAQATLLCFDEMQVTDITDAMLLGRLFERFFERGVVVVATSNRPPADLYKDGLNRDLFLPFIAMLEERMNVHELDSATDHRLSGVSRGGVWFSPPGPETQAAIDGVWRSLASGAKGAPATLLVHSREVPIPLAYGGVARARFADLCERPLGPADFLALADRFDTLILEDVPVLGRAQANAAKRFVTLIDALYEARRRLIVSAAAEPDALYEAGDGAFEFRRTASRLNEMRSEAYLEMFETRRRSR